MKNIPLFKVFMPDGVSSAVEKTLLSGYLAEGDKVKAFTQAIEDYIGNKHVVCMNSCTTALTIAYRLSGVVTGSEVISTPLTSICTNAPLLGLGAKIVWADCDPNTGMVDPQHVETLINENTKALVILHKDGDLADLDKLYKITQKHNIKLIEDAAHAFGAKYNGKKIGNHGDFVCFSFQAIKHITSGDGGALICRSFEDYKKAQEMKWLGINKFDNPGVNPWTIDIKDWGYKGNMNDLSATIGLESIKYIDDVVEKFHQNGMLYDQLLYGVDGVQLIPRREVDKPIFWTYCFLAEKRDELIKLLNESGIEAGVVHPRNDNYSVLADFKRPLPGLDYFSSREINLPCGWWINEDDINRIVNIIKLGW